MRAQRFLWSGDSITEGYSDGAVVSCNGFTQRMNAPYYAGIPDVWHINLGCSGFMVPQYIRRAKGVIDANPDAFTAVFCSVWSPNMPSGVVENWPYLEENLDAMIAALESFETFLLDRSIIFVPTFVENPPYPMGASSGARMKLRDYFFPKLAALWSWWLNLQPATQDPAILDGPQMAFAGAGADGTHPTPSQHDAIAAYAQADSGNGVPRWKNALNLAAAHYGFSE